MAQVRWLQNTNFRKTFWGIGAGLTALFVVLIFGGTLFSDILNSFENQTLDWRFQYRERFKQGTAPIEDIVIVDIDERSLDKYGQFPWPRGYYADVLDILSDDGVLGVAFDVQFFDEAPDSMGDRRFVEAVGKAGNVVNAVALYPEDKDNFRYTMNTNPYARFIPKTGGMEDISPVEFDLVEGPSMELASASASLGFVNFISDDDGVVRKMPLILKAANDYFVSLPIALINATLFGDTAQSVVYNDGEIVPIRGFEAPVDKDGILTINFLGPPGSFRYVSFYDVKEGRLPKGFFEGKFVFIGTSAKGLADLKAVPLSSVFPGVELHATVMYDILTDNYLRNVNPILFLALLIIITLLFGFLIYRLSAFKGFMLFILFLPGCFAFIVFVFIKYSIIVEMVKPTFSLSLTYIFAIVHRYFGEEQEKIKYKGILQHYVAPTVVKQVVNDIDGLKLGGESRELTLLFSDIEGFTGISEKLSPQQLVTLLNEYTTAQTNAVFEYYGTLDKYIGDAIVVIFGAPEIREDINYAEAACRAALKIRENDNIISRKFQHLSIGEIKTRIGVNTGEAVVGNMGSDVRFAYTAIGDSVNLASRLEGLNKEYGTRIIISETTRKYTSKKFITRELDLVRVKGRKQPVRIYELIKYGTPDDFLIRLTETFSKGLRKYREMDFDGAKRIFAGVLEFSPDDGPARTFMERCELLSAGKLPDNWDGVWIMRNK